MIPKNANFMVSYCLRQGENGYGSCGNRTFADYHSAEQFVSAEKGKWISASIFWFTEGASVVDLNLVCHLFEVK